MLRTKEGLEIESILRRSEFEITKVYNENYTSNLILHSGAQKPGLALAGYLKYLDPYQLQVFGKTETGYLMQLPKDEFEKQLKDFLSRKVPGIIITENQEVDKNLIAIAGKYKTPVLISKLKSSLLISRLWGFLYRYFAEKIKLHGVLMDIMGMGILITGPSGIGKSETALELVSRGSQLISDDLVEFYVNPNDEVVGRCIDRIKQWIEVRGLGIINIVEMYGYGAFLEEKKLDLVIQLEQWNPKKQYDRLGTDSLIFNVLGKDIPMFSIPVAVGRNLATIIEVAVKYFIARKSGCVPFLEYINNNGNVSS